MPIFRRLAVPQSRSPRVKSSTDVRKARSSDCVVKGILPVVVQKSELELDRKRPRLTDGRASHHARPAAIDCLKQSIGKSRLGSHEAVLTA